MNTKEEQSSELLHKCPKCPNRLPIMAENGMHNFCPATYEPVSICIECKMKEVVAGWEGRGRTR